MAATTHQIPSDVPPAELPRPRTVVVGTAFGTGAVLIFFAVLLGLYLETRSAALAAGETWIPEGTISLVPGGMMALTMALSIVTMHWALYSIARDDRTNAYVAFGLTALFGVAVINQTVFLYNEMGLVITETVPALFIYVITGSHLAMLVAAIIFIGLMAFRALAGQYTSRQTDGITAAALFWDATVVVYAAIYYAIYIVK